MGLDIFAYSKLIRVTEELTAEEIDDRGLLEVEMSDNICTARIDPTEAGVFSYNEEDVFIFRAGSYSGYNQVRAVFSQIGMGVEPETVWNDPSKYEGQPFYEIANFSDCEGVIGATVCKKLLIDFRKYKIDLTKALLKNLYSDASQSTDYIDSWIRALELAADGGVLVFA